MAHKASSSSSSSKKKISLKTADNVVFEIDASIAKQIKTVQSFIDEDEDVKLIPLPNVLSKELPLIIQYCKKYVAGKITKEFEAEFVKEMTNEELKALFIAANYLNVETLFDFLRQFIANRIENKSVEYVRDFFGVENDFTPDEEAKLRRENSWTFRGVDEDDD